jgi:hypothetical protein
MNSMVLADGSVLDIRDTGLPASRNEKFITFVLYGVRIQNKVGASPAIRDWYERKMALTRGNMQPALQRHGLPHQSSEPRLKEDTVLERRKGAG